MVISWCGRRRIRMGHRRALHLLARIVYRDEATSKRERFSACWTQSKRILGENVAWRKNSFFSVFIFDVNRAHHHPRCTL